MFVGFFCTKKKNKNRHFFAFMEEELNGSGKISFVVLRMVFKILDPDGVELRRAWRLRLRGAQHIMAYEI